MRPIGERVIVYIRPAEETQANGLFIPETARTQAWRKGIVVAVGDKAAPIEEGDVVLVGEYGGVSLPESQWLFNTHEVLAVLDEE